MVEISNVKVYDLKESVIACRNAMRLEIPEYTDEEFEKSLIRAKKLVAASYKSEVTCHDNWLVGVRVSFDIKYPGYISPELQRYHFLDIVTSSSKMHRITKMDFSKCCNKYVSPAVKHIMEDMVNDYNNYLENSIEMESGQITSMLIEFFNKYTDWTSERTAEELKTHTPQYLMFMCIVSNCPMGVELFMRCTTNYKQLQTIYRQRKHHKLKEDWGAFCKFIEELPYASDFITYEPTKPEEKQRAEESVKTEEVCQNPLPEAKAMVGNYVAYYFKTRYADSRPYTDVPFKEKKLPWWCTGEGEDERGDFTTILCYLTPDMKLEDYWDDAYDIDMETAQEIEYSDRFPAPDWCK